jgi:hypothetical protein
MRINRKALKLIDKGLSSKTVSKLTETQINVLYSRMISETEVKVSSKNPNAAQIAKDMNAKGVSVTMTEKEIEEDYKDGPNPWAICHAQVGPKKTRKFERCVMAVKKQLKEGKNPLSLFLETKIEKIVEKHLPPRITKGDLLKVISESQPAGEPASPKRKTDLGKKPVSPSVKRRETKEQATAPAPAKPATRPSTKPTEKPKEKPFHPARNPRPGVQPSPLAKKRETKEQATAPAPAKPATRPTTKPSTTPKEKPFHPARNPRPGVQPSPLANRVSPEDAKEKVIDVIIKILEK